MKTTAKKHSLVIIDDDLQLIAEHVMELSQDNTKPFNVETVATLLAQCLVACSIVNENT